MENFDLALRRKVEKNMETPRRRRKRAKQSESLEMQWKFNETNLVAQKVESINYYPTALRRVQITPKTSTISCDICTPEDRLNRFALFSC